MKIKLLLLSLAVASVSCKKEETEKTIETKVTDTVKEEMATIPDSATISKAWNEFMTPNDVHKKLSADTGTWTEEISMWQSADMPPTKSTATADVKMILGGRYQEMIHKGDFMGMPFEGRGTLAYDNAAKEYVSTWIDNMGTGIMVMRGSYDDTSKTYKMSGEVVDPVTKKKKTTRETVTIIDDKTQKVEMYDTGYDGKEFKCMEILMKKK